MNNDVKLHHCGPDGRISANIERTATTFGKHINVAYIMYPTGFPL